MWQNHTGIKPNENVSSFCTDIDEKPYTLFQNGGQYVILLFACLLALFSSFSLQNSFVFFIHVDKPKEGFLTCKQKNNLLVAILE